MKRRTICSFLAASSALLIVSVGAAVATAGASVAFPAGGDAAGKAAAHARAHWGVLEEDVEDCAAEASTCLADEECLECMTSYVDHPVDYTACLLEYGSSLSSETTCDEEAARPCCANSMSRGNCLESGSFLEYWGCNLREFHGCGDYEMTCAGVKSEVSDSSGGSSSSSAGGATSSPVAEEEMEEEVVASEGSGTVATAVPLARIAIVCAGALAGMAASAAGADLLLMVQ
ncbi:unnamed protein product [Scytosiphon promiscuus]